MKKSLLSVLIAAMMLLCFGLVGCGKAVAYAPHAEGVQTAVSTEAPAPAADTSAQVVSGNAVHSDTSLDYLSPLVTLRADPYLYKSPTTGKYYFTGSYPEYDRIDLRSADTINGIASAEPKVIWERENSNIGHVWAPELHYVMGQWVIYYAASETPGDIWDIKCRALRCKGDDPMNDAWEKVGVIEKAAGDTSAFTGRMSLDMTVFENKGKWYAIWAETARPHSNLYLAELETPFKLKTVPILITKPEYAWETDRESVNEGPSVLKNAGKIFVSFSAAATGYEYCMGLLEVSEDADILNAANWKKRTTPVFQTDASRQIYGPGHNSFVKGDNDEWLCILHFRNYKDIIGGNGNSLYDHNRHAHVMKLQFDEDGAPLFDFGEGDLFNTNFKNDGM